jgi:putative ATP-dependent endonuclease of the OLD family
MYIDKIKIVNFKSFEGEFELKFNKDLNIIVGDNEAGKSTILEAINLVLSGLVGGKYIKNELSQYFFNNNVVSRYLTEIADNGTAELPYILIEVYLEGSDLARLEGDDNTDDTKAKGVYLRIAFDDRYQSEYEELIKKGTISTLPLEYYDIYWGSFAREATTGRTIPVKTAFIDSSSARFYNGSDIYISRIVKEFLETEDIVAVSQAHRKMKDVFSEDASILNINTKIKTASKISDKEVKLSVDLSTKNAWEGSLLTYLDDVPFHYIGKGEQSIVKTKLALSHKKSKEACVILVEEPENHLSYTKLNQLLGDIINHKENKQVIVTTHSSFVANKLGLESLVILNDHKTVRLNALSDDTQTFFAKLAGYDTLRLILCKKAILVEGDSDELIVQRAYMDSHDSRLPIQDSVDVISVGTSFLRFLEIAEKINQPVVVITDNDGDVAAIKKKYENYLDNSKKDFIDISYDDEVDSGALEINGKKFNYNTLEPKLVKANSLDVFNKILGTDYKNLDDLHKHMRKNKTDCALKVYTSAEKIVFPRYIVDAVK